MADLIIRREKRQVISQLPNITVLDIPVKMHPDQAYYHAAYAKGIAQILQKVFKTPYDMQKLMLLLSKMRMVCDSTYLVDLETNISPKLDELRLILAEKLDLTNSDRKVIIFSEWKRMNHIIGKMLREENIGFAELNGSVAVNKRGLLIREDIPDSEVAEDITLPNTVPDIDDVTHEEPELSPPAENESAIPAAWVPPAEHLEQVMNQGMGFLAGLFKMATGKDLIAGEQTITIDKQTGEVIMKFRLPV